MKNLNLSSMSNSMFTFVEVIMIGYESLSSEMCVRPKLVLSAQLSLGRRGGEAVVGGGREGAGRRVNWGCHFGMDVRLDISKPTPFIKNRDQSYTYRSKLSPINILVWCTE